MAYVLNLPIKAAKGVDISDAWMLRCLIQSQNDPVGANIYDPAADATA